MTPDDRGNQAAVQHTRRRLLRGTFAAPAVLTVYSGGALAAGSVGACLARPNALPPGADVLTKGNNSDLLFRIQLWAVVRSDGSVASLYVSGFDLKDFARDGQTPFLSSTQYQQFLADNANNTLTGPILNAPPALVTGQRFEQVQSYAVVRVSETGDIVGIGGTGSGSPVSESCWNSFAMATLP